MKRYKTGLYTTLYTFELTEQAKYNKRLKYWQSRARKVTEIFVNNALAFEIWR